jgi:selenocysteine lyase/cysteine desulfurase
VQFRRHRLANCDTTPDVSANGLTDEPRFHRGAFLAGTGAAAAGLGLTGAAKATRTALPRDLRTWPGVRREFVLRTPPIHFDTFLLASHPSAVRAAIDRYRRALDADPHEYLNERQGEIERRVVESASAYLGVRANEIALTDSTTMGLGLVYGGLRLDPEDEVLTTAHDFYATHEAFRLRSLRVATTVRRIRLYGDAETASVDGILRAVRNGITPRTRVLAVTWVHSSSGVKLPLARIAELVASVNRSRPRARRVLLAVDGVHGLGNQPENLPDLGCDIFVSGCHKWLFGPRGTGIVWMNGAGAEVIGPVIPSFDGRSYVAWLFSRAPTDLPKAAAMTPGGFHSFEHRWALAEAFAFHRSIGKRRVAERTHELASELKAQLAALPKVRLRTPRAEELSAGLVCFEHESRSARGVVDALRSRGIVVTVTPYATEYVRLGPSILNSPAEVDRAVRAIATL